ncbi:armadillo-type protein [Sphaerosporella brunnea]|uniref:Armadillo-type protein n=1 Tax=Sphaerosporella brunnea TaxID=1250544 RepID=A0A5J5ENM0_9PEZI|nr:armadillo-type protein [Sphaerosporella brunnea]KAA8897793.1 armadillo-type protein [Sphaerosporella brunnea]
MVPQSRTPQGDSLTDVEDAPSSTLTFNEPLSWKAGKPIALNILLARLGTLSKQLASLGQEGVDRDSLAIPAKELAHVSLMQHRDEGVRALVACCLADMLRLHAPDAPYTANQLKDIFACFVKCLQGFEDPESKNHGHYLYLLESLSTVKSIVLISDIPESEEITLSLFTTFFDLANPDAGVRNIEYHMTDILTQLIEECNSLPSEVVDIIMAQFLRMAPAPVQINKKGGPARGEVDEKQTKLTSVVPPPAYNMAKSICNACVDKMARHICQYFSEVVLDAAPSRRLGSPEGEGEEDVKHHEPTHEDLHDLRKAHLLAKELWKACPQVLQNVIPQLEQELLADNGEIRKLACETIGEMALTGNLLSSAPATWKEWVKRANDKSPGVRAKWVQAAVRILKERTDNMAVQLVDLIALKLNDLDEQVRFTVCQAMRSLDYLTITTKLAADQSPFNLYNSSNSIAATNINRKVKTEGETKGWGKKILLTLAERVRDKKIHVRLEGMRCLARMWDMAYKDIADGNEVVFAQLGWIPSKILDTFYINDPEVNVLLDHVLHEILIPVNYPPIEKERYGAELDKAAGTKGKSKEVDSKEREREIMEGDKKRVRRLLVLVKGLDQKAKRALFAVPLRQISYAKVMEVFLKACEDNNSGVIEEGVDEAAVQTTLEKFSFWLSQKLPEPLKAKENLQKFAKLHDRRCYQLIRFCFNPDSDYRTVVKALKEIKKRIGETAQQGILDSLTPLLYRVSQLIYNKSHVAPIIEFSRSNELALGSTAHEVLKEMSSSSPAVFKANVKALSDLLQECSPTSGSPDRGAVDTLKACAGFAKSYPNDMPRERNLLQSLVSFALTGSPPAAAKHAVTILMYSASRKELYASDLVQSCIKDFKLGGKDFKFGEKHFLAKLACLGQLVLLAPEQCEDEAKTIRDFASNILQTSKPADEPKPTDEGEDEESNSAWAEEAELDDEIKAKLLALRVLVNLVRSHPNVNNTQDIATIKTLNKIVANGGELLQTKGTPASHRSRLRLAAAQHLLKLATPGHDDLISPVDFNRLAVVAQDRCPQVRQGFINKLKKYLANGRLSPRFYTIVFLMAYESNEGWREEVAIWIRGRANTLSKSATGHNVVEAVFARLMSLLIHHPDFGKQVKDLTDFSKYILFYLRTVANEENISLIYYIAQRAKQYRDKLSPDNSDNLYYLSELSQAVIRHYADHQKWAILTWPGKLRLPAALFAPMQDAKESQEISQKTFLPEGLDKKLGNLVRTSKHNAIPSTSSNAAVATTGRKRKNETGTASAAANPAPKSKKAKAESTSTRSKKSTTKKKTRKESTPPPPEKGRRRSGRHANKVTNYTVDTPSDDEEFEEEESDVDEEMADASSEQQSESEPEVRSRRASGRSRTSTGGGRRKSSVSIKAAESIPAEGESMDVDEPEPATEKEPEKAAAPVAPMAAATTATVAVRKRPTRAQAQVASKGKAPEKKQPVTSPRRSSRSKPKEQQEKIDWNSSELSDVPDE